MKQPTKRIASLQLRTRYSAMRVTLVRTTKKIRRRRRKKKNGVAVGAGAEARVVVEAKAEAEAEVGVEVGVEVEATAAADPKAVERVRAIKPLSRT